jgi:dipeptidyl aminopeptidase/acylaminoacyl peptidase
VNLRLLRELACGAVLLSITTTPVSAAQDPQDMSSAWSAPESPSVLKIDKTFANGPDQLRGTLYVPSVSQRVPAVVAFHGASTPTREAPLFRHLEQMLPQLGVAVFVYDRRGSGESVGKPARGDYGLLADDGLAAARMLAQDSRIDPRRIGFWGLSQGGWLSLLAASRSADVAFAISVSAPITTPDVQMIFAVANILRIKGYSQPDIDTAIAARKAVDDFERSRLDRATAQRRLDEAMAKPWFDLIYMDRTFADPDQSGWAKEIKNDPLPTLYEVKVPTLIIYGAKDPWIPVRASLDLLQQHALQLPNVETAVIPGADHNMMLSISVEAQIAPAHLTDYAPEAAAYFSLLASWLTAHGITSSGEAAIRRGRPDR